MANKRYWWLKLPTNFFDSKEMKKLRKIAGGDTYTIIYLKLLLLASQNNGKVYFDQVEDTFAEELALEINEEAENIKVTLMYLERQGLLDIIESDEYELTQCVEMVGSESESAARKRKQRNREKPLQIKDKTGIYEDGNCDNVTPKRDNVTPMSQSVTKSVTIEKEIEKELELEKELEKEKEKEKEKEIEKEKEKKEKKKKDVNKQVVYFDDDFLNTSFLDYLDIRKKLKVPNTERVITRLIRFLDNYDDQMKSEILDKAITCGWKDLYPPKENIDKKHQRKENDIENGILNGIDWLRA